MVDFRSPSGTGASRASGGRIKKLHLTLALIAVICFAGGYFTHSLMTSPPKLDAVLQDQNDPDPTEVVDAQNATPVQNRDLPTRQIVGYGNDPAIGPASAPVTIIEFSDFQCAYCQQFNQQMLDQLIVAYGDRISFVYRDFPLTSTHPNAQKAAEAAACADDQGEFWSMHDLLFAGQQEWSGKPDSVDVFTRYAGELDLDVDQFTECVNTGQKAAQVWADYQAGQTAGVTGTPSFFVNGRPLRGAVSLSIFKAIIDAELSRIGG